MGWTATDPRWAALDPFQKAAAMALMEANGGRDQSTDAHNVVGAMVNRARKGGEDLGVHVGQSNYQTSLERAQQGRLSSIIGNASFPALTEFARARWEGRAEDNVAGATHFLAHEPTMRSLSAREPNKYRSWRGWSGYGRDEPGAYSNPDRAPVVRDASHAFLHPEGAYSAPGTYGGSGFKKREFDDLSDAFGPGTPTLPSTARAPFMASAPDPKPAPAQKKPPMLPPVIAAAAPTPAPAEKKQQTPFFSPPATSDGLDKFHGEAVRQAQQVAMESVKKRRPVTGLSAWNDQLFGGASNA